MDRKTIVAFALGIMVAVAFFIAFPLLQGALPFQQSVQTKPAQAPQTLQKFKASGYSTTYEGIFLVIDAGSERGIWASNGLAPEWDYAPSPVGPASLGKQLASGIKIGLHPVADILVARSDGMPVKIVACHSNTKANKIYVKADSPIKSMKDLDGKKIGVGSKEGATGRVATYLSNKLGIKPEIVVTGNQSVTLAALKVGRVDAISDGSIPILRLVDSGELRVLAQLVDYLPNPRAHLCVFATEDLIEQNPDLVRRFVKATLESVRYIDENPKYAEELYIKRSNAPRDLAEKVSSQYERTPGGRGNGADLHLAVKNSWEYAKNSGVVPADAALKVEDAVDIRFLP